MMRFALAVLLYAEAWAHPDDSQTLVQQAYHSRGSTMPTMDEKLAHEESLKTSLLEGLKQGDLPWTVDGVRTSLNRSMQELQILHDSVENVMNSYQAGASSMEGPIAEVIKQFGKDVPSSRVKDVFKETRQRLGQVMDDISAKVPSLLALANQKRGVIDKNMVTEALKNLQKDWKAYTYLWLFSILPAVAFTQWHEGFSVSASMPISVGREMFLPASFGGPYDDLFTVPTVTLKFANFTVSICIPYGGYTWDKYLEHAAKGQKVDSKVFLGGSVSVRMNTNYVSSYGLEKGTDWFLDWSFSFKVGLRFNPAVRGIAVLGDNGEKVEKAGFVKGGRPFNAQVNCYQGVRWPFSNFSDYTTSWGMSLTLGVYFNRVFNKKRTVKPSLTLVWGQDTMTQPPRKGHLEMLRNGKIPPDQSTQIWENMFAADDVKDDELLKSAAIPRGYGLAFATWPEAPLAPAVQDQLAKTVKVDEPTRQQLLELCQRSNEIGVAAADGIPKTTAAPLDDDETDLTEIKLHQEDVLARQVKVDVSMTTPSFPVDCLNMFPKELTKLEAWDTCVKYMGIPNCGVAKASWLKEEDVSQIIEWTAKDEVFEPFSYEKQETEEEDKKVEEDKKEEVKVEER